MTKRGFLGIVITLLCLSSGNAQGLFGFTGSGGLYSVSSDPPSATFIGSDSSIERVAEIEYGNGVIYAPDTVPGSRLHVVSPTTGTVIDTMLLDFPAGGNVLTALEFVNGTLFGGFTTAINGGDTAMVTIDTTTGVVNLVESFSGIGSPLGGLAWNGSTLYGVSGGGHDADLYSFNLDTGAATFETSIADVSGEPISLTALEFGTDGVLYSMPSVSSPNGGNLLIIDPNTGIYTDLGSTGIFLSSLTSIRVGSGCDFDLGDVNQDGEVDFLDIQPFVDVLNAMGFQCEADVNADGAVDFLDIQPFVDLLS